MVPQLVMEVELLQRVIYAKQLQEARNYAWVVT